MPVRRANLRRPSGHRARTAGTSPGVRRVESNWGEMGRMTDVDMAREAVVHHCDWTASAGAGRGSRREPGGSGRRGRVGALAGLRSGSFQGPPGGSGGPARVADGQERQAARRGQVAGPGPSARPHDAREVAGPLLPGAPPRPSSRPRCAPSGGRTTRPRCRRPARRRRRRSSRPRSLAVPATRPPRRGVWAAGRSTRSRARRPAGRRPTPWPSRSRRPLDVPTTGRRGTDPGRGDSAPDSGSAGRRRRSGRRSHRPPRPRLPHRGDLRPAQVVDRAGQPRQVEAVGPGIEGDHLSLGVDPAVGAAGAGEHHRVSEETGRAPR